MTTTPVDLTALVGSRICHDLISPLGAISNGVELLTMTGGAMGPEMALIAESVENANARIRFFRIAFGAAEKGQTLPRSEVLSVLGDVTRGGRLQIEWQAADPMERGDVKIAFLLIQCLETAMPFGGRITIAETDGRWRIVGTSDKMKILPETWEVLANSSGAVAVAASEVHFGLIPQLLHRAERTLQTELSDDRIEINF